MEFNNEIDEGIINIPKSMKIANTFFTQKKPKYPHFRQNSLLPNMMKAPSLLREKDFNNRDILKNKTKMGIYRSNKKSEDNLSTTTKASVHDKIKKVTFSTVEIIRVENYKRYNKLNSIKKVEIGNENERYNNICHIF